MRLFRETGWAYWRSVWDGGARVVWSFPDCLEPCQMICATCEIVGLEGSQAATVWRVNQHNESKAHRLGLVLLGPFGGNSF